MPKELHTRYLNARDKIVDTWEHLEDEVPDIEKPHYRQLMFEYLLEMFGGWEHKGDCLPTSQYLYHIARIREQLEAGK